MEHVSRFSVDILDLSPALIGTYFLGPRVMKGVTGARKEPQEEYCSSRVESLI
jgi:hypothetical protein